MGLGLLGFAGAAAGGMQAGNERNREQTRQDVADAQRTQEFNLRLQMLQGQAGDQALERQDKMELRDTIKPIDMKSEWSANVSGQTPEEQQATAEKMSTGEFTAPADPGATPADPNAAPVNAMPDVTQGFTVNGTSYADKTSGLAAAADYNSLQAQSKRLSGIYRRHGRSDLADANDLAFIKNQTNVANAHRDLFSNNAAGAIEEGGADGLVALSNKQQNGIVSSHVPDGKGGGTIFHQRDGIEVGTPLQYASKSDLQDKVYASLYSQEMQKARQASVYEIAKERNKPISVAPGASISEIDPTTGKRVITAENAGFYDPLTGTYSRSGKGGATAPAPIWNDKADAFLTKLYTLKNENTGALDVDGAGMEFGKSMAIAYARANGGDTTIALGRAFDSDNKLKAQVQADVKSGAIKPEAAAQALNVKRAAVIQSLSAPVAAQPPVPVADVRSTSSRPASPLASQPADSDKALIYRSELAKMRSRLAQASGNPDPRVAGRAQEDIDSIMREMQANGITPTGASPAPAATAAAPAASAPKPMTMADLGRAAVGMPKTVPGAPAPAPQAPQVNAARSTDGGQSWDLDIPEQIRDPKVPYYKLIPNPVFAAMSGKKFASRDLANAAYAQATK